MKSTDLSKYDDIKDDLARHSWTVEQAAAYEKIATKRNADIERKEQTEKSEKTVIDLAVFLNKMQSFYEKELTSDK